VQDLRVTAIHRCVSISLAVATAALLGCQMQPGQPSRASAPRGNDTVTAQAPQRWVSQGPATIAVAKLYDCPVVVDNYRGGSIGRLTSIEGMVLTMPAVTAYQHGLGPKSIDLYNECTQVMPSASSDVSTDHAPVVEVDPEGEVITGFIIADNYYELYVNGTRVSVDNTPYTPFNSAIVKFRARRPYTLAFLLVDWDEHMGLGMELFPQGPRSDRLLSGDPWYMGDAGLQARFSDGTVTDTRWKAQSFYIAPLDSPDEVIENGSIHDTSARGRVTSAIQRSRCAVEAGDVTGADRLFPALGRLPSRCYAVHYPIPPGWQQSDFDDSAWPDAFAYTDDDVGTRNLPAYNRYPELFAGAQWIWTINLALDNVVLARYTVH
jgi:hypothetical protein